MGKPEDVFDVAHQQSAEIPTVTYSATTPSLRLLFSYCTRRDVALGVVPAILTSLAAGAVAPFMTHVIGQAMAIFASSSDADADARHHLMHTMSVVALEFVGLAIGSLALSSLMSTFWVWVGERIVKRLRHEVFLAATSREI